jgi:hypothetical protein
MPPGSSTPVKRDCLNILKLGIYLRARQAGSIIRGDKLEKAQGKVEGTAWLTFM